MTQRTLFSKIPLLQKTSWQQAIANSGLWLFTTFLLSVWRLRHPAFGLQGDLPVHYHILRSFAHSQAEGDWFPRWAGLLDGGHGDALFTFYPPLGYWIGSPLINVFGVGVLSSLKITSVISFLLAQFGAYKFARAFFSPRTSLIVSGSYVLLPALPLITLHRAFLANAMALSLVPFVLLGAHRLLHDARPRRGALIFVSSFGLLILTHAITSYLCGVALLLLVVCYLPQARWRSLYHLTLAGLSTLAVTAFFWWPQRDEIDWVQVGLQVVQQDYRHYFLFAEAANDSAYRQAWAGLNLITSFITLAQTALALLLGISCWRAVSRQNSNEADKTNLLYKPLVLFGLALAATGFFLSLPLSDVFWRYVPGLKFVQFPWRLQPIVALGCGLLAAISWELKTQNNRRWRLLLTLSLPWLVLINGVFTLSITRLNEPTITRAQVATVLNPQPLPAISQDESRRLLNENNLRYLPYTANQVYFRPQGAELTLYPPAEQPGGLTILAGQGNVAVKKLFSAQREFQIEAAEPLRARLETYWYPHWVVRLDGREITPQKEANSGLMLLDIPTGSHTVTLSFEVRTGSERLARWLSLLSGIVLLGWALWKRKA